MKFPNFITALKIGKFLPAAIPAIFACVVLLSGVYAQKISVFAPFKTPQSEAVIEILNKRFASKLKLSDYDLTSAVFRNSDFENPFNLSAEEAKNFGNAVGCDYFLFVRAENVRRFSLSKNDYYESFAAFHLTDSRTGKQIFWTLKNAEAQSAEEADKKLFSEILNIEKEILPKIAAAEKEDFAEISTQIKEPPAENSPESKNFRIPLPYRRIRPGYTVSASLYSVQATVDVSVDLDETGKITRLEIVRGAGYGLDESVEKAVREMRWRPAESGGKPLPIRILLRYNFKKIQE